MKQGKVAGISGEYRAYFIYWILFCLKMKKKRDLALIHQGIVTSYIAQLDSDPFLNSTLKRKK